MKTIKELLGLSEAKKKKMEGEDPCWDNYEMVGTKKKNGKEVPNCVPKNEEVKSTDENFGADFLAMARQKNPNARLVTPDQKKKEAEELAKKRAGLKPAHAAPTGNSRPLGGYDPKSNRSYSEEVEDVEEGLTKVLKRLATGKDVKSRAGQEIALAQQASMTGDNKAAHKHFKRYDKLDKLGNKEQGVKEEVEQVDELNKDTVYSYNKKSTADTEKLHKKLGEFIRKNKSAEANKTAHKLNKRVAGQERADARLNTEEAALEEAKAKKEETPSKKDIVKGEKLSGKQEPVNVNPELKEK